MLCTFVLPIDGNDPPTTAIIKELDTVDPAHKRFGIFRGMTRFVRAPEMRDMPELFGAPRNLFFEKSVLLGVRGGPSNEGLDIEHLRRDFLFGTRCAWLFKRRDEARA